MTSRGTDSAFSIGRWCIRPNENRLIDGDQVVSIEPRVMSVLVCLSRRPGDIVSASELVDDVWHGRAHGDHTVYQAIADLRKALGDDANNPRYIETISKKGYRLIAEVATAPVDTVGAESKRTALRGHRTALVATLIIVATSVAFLALSGQIRDRWQQAAEDSGTQSIAVLPFVNMSDDPANEFLADGLSEEIRNLLTSIPGLKVFGRSSSQALRDEDNDIREIGQLLGVRTVLDGSVRKSGDRVRITAQLIDTATGTQTWSETYDREITGLFEVQDDVAAAVIVALQLHVGSHWTRGRPTDNPRAYTLFLKARASLGQYDARFAEQLLREAVALDPAFAEAYELLAAAYFRLGGNEIDALEGQRLTGEAAGKALAINPNLVFARALYQAGNLESWSYAGEIAALETAAREQPSNVELLNALHWDLSVAGYLEDALSIAERMVELDPLSPTANARLIELLYASGRVDEAIAELELQAKLGIDLSVWNLGLINLAEMHDDAAIAYLDAAYQRSFYPPEPGWMREFVNNARSPVNGQGFLSSHIENVVASMSAEDAYNWRMVQTHWYLVFGYVDRYLDEILRTNLTASNWTDADGLIRGGILYRRLGFTAHPKFLDVARATGIVDTWERRGPPDFCQRIDGEWLCE